MATYNAVLDAMGAPVRKDLEARRRQPVRTTREMEQAARLFLIEAFRRGPYFMQTEHGIDVQLTSGQDIEELMNLAQEVRKNRRQEDNDSMQDSWGPVSTYIDFQPRRNYVTISRSTVVLLGFS
ncbi:hypothetical protein NKH33_31385 [Mesorhizobium sp. M1182]|uniref:hypothetical protein n=1 Tax=Mesorhizobium sp. M1182 TaxID=2957067 RepID=UPI003338C0F1